MFGLALSARLPLLSSTAKSAALTADRSHHPSLLGIRLASGRTACAAPRMASVNSLASSVTLARWPAISSMLSTNFRITRSRKNLVFSWLLSNDRGCGVYRTRRLWANRPPRSTVYALLSGSFMFPAGVAISTQMLSSNVWSSRERVLSSNRVKERCTIP